MKGKKEKKTLPVREGSLLINNNNNNNTPPGSPYTLSSSSKLIDRFFLKLVIKKMTT